MPFKTALVIILLFLGQIKEETQSIQLINLAIFSALGALIFSDRLKENVLKNISLVLVILLISGYLISASSAINNKAESFSLDEPIGCTSDEQDFLKTFYLMKQGNNFYSSFSQALVNCGGFLKAPNDSTGWRFPTVFYLWKLFAQNGWQIRTTFLIFSSLALFCSYLLTRKLSDYKIALLSPYMIIPYFLEAVSGHSFIFMEWWGLFFLIFGLTALLYEKRILSLGFLVLSVLSRETFLIPASTIVFIDFLNHKKFNYLGVFLAAVGGFWILHNMQISNTVGNITFNLQSRIHTFDKNALMSALAFSTKTYKFVYLRIGTLLLFISAIGLVKLSLFVKKTDRKLAYISAASFLTLTLLAPFLITRATYEGVYQYGDYWGITFVPLAIIFSPLILSTKQ